MKLPVPWLLLNMCQSINFIDSTNPVIVRQNPHNHDIQRPIYVDLDYYKGPVFTHPESF